MRVMVINKEDGFRSASVHEVVEVCSTDTIYVDSNYVDEDPIEIKYPALRMANDPAHFVIYLVGYYEKHEEIIRTLAKTGFYDFSSMEDKIVYNPTSDSDETTIKMLIAEDKSRSSLSNPLSNSINYAKPTI